MPIPCCTILNLYQLISTKECLGNGQTIVVDPTPHESVTFRQARSSEGLSSCGKSMYVQNSGNRAAGSQSPSLIGRMMKVQSFLDTVEAEESQQMWKGTILNALALPTPTVDESHGLQLSGIL